MIWQIDTGLNRNVVWSDFFVAQHRWTAVLDATRGAINGPEAEPAMDWGNRSQVLEKVVVDGQALKFASDSLRSDLEVVLNAVEEDGYALEFASQELRNDYNVVMVAVQQDGLALEFASEELQGDYSIVSAAVAEDGQALEFASYELRDDPTIVLSALRRRGLCFQWATMNLRRDRDFVLSAIDMNWEAFQFAAKELRADKEMVGIAVGSKGRALEFASRELRADSDLVLKATQRDAEGFQFAAKHLRKDADFVLELLKINGQVIRYAHEELLSSKDFILKVVQSEPDALQYASSDLRGDRQVVMAAVHSDGYALEYAAEELQRDRSIVLAAVREDGLALEFAAPKLRKDWYIVLTAVESNASSLVYADWELRVDRTFILEAVKVNGRVMDYVQFLEFHGDSEILGASVVQLLSSVRRQRGPELEFSLTTLTTLAQHDCGKKLVAEYQTLLKCLTVNVFDKRTRLQVVALFDRLSRHAGAMLFHIAQCASLDDTDDENCWLRFCSIDILQQWFMKDRHLFCSSVGHRAAMILAIGLQERLDNPTEVEFHQETAVLLDEVMDFIREEIPDFLEVGSEFAHDRLADVSMISARTSLNTWFSCNSSEGTRRQPRVVDGPPSGKKWPGFSNDVVHAGRCH